MYNYQVQNIRKSEGNSHTLRRKRMDKFPSVSMKLQLIALIHPNHQAMLILHPELELYTGRYELMVSAIDTESHTFKGYR